MCKRPCLCCSYTVLHSEFCYKRGEGSKFVICATICENDMIVPGKIYTLCCVLTCVRSVTNAAIKHSQLIVEIYWYFKLTLLTPPSVPYVLVTETSSRSIGLEDVCDTFCRHFTSKQTSAARHENVLAQRPCQHLAETLK